MAMTLRLTAVEDESLTRLAKTFNTSKNLAVAAAIDLASPKASHPEMVQAATTRLLARYSDLMARLEQA